jgi:serine protease Do
MNDNKKVVFYPSICLLFLFTLVPQIVFSRLTEGPTPKKIQKLIKSHLERAYEASVYMHDYDTLTKRPTGQRFSGVVVSSTGTIMTAGHAVNTGKTYLVTFPNGGKEYVAVGLGRIASFDAAVVQIKEKGIYPYAEMGYSSSLKVNEPCMSIAYPGSFTPKRLVVRFGVVAELPTNKRRTMRTTCLMEPGDSGGPVFDLYGRVIGIRSNITKELENNYDAPVDLFRKYWSSLLKSENYQFLPKADEPTKDPLEKERYEFAGPDQLALQLAKDESKFQSFALQLINKGDSSSALGTIINLKGLTRDRTLLEKTFILSKGSLIKDGVRAKIGDSLVPAGIVYRDIQSDLILLSLKVNIKGGLDKSVFPLESNTLKNIGDILISPDPVGKGEISILGSSEFNLSKTYSGGYLGLGFGEDGKSRQIAMIVAKSPASASALKIGDEVTDINDNPINSADMFISEIQKFSADDIVKIGFKRSDSIQATDVKLGGRPTLVSTHAAEKFDGGKSKRFDGFEQVFIHDAKILPSACGGPVFDLNGKLRGMNIARYSRTSSLAVAPLKIKTFLEAAVLQLSGKPTQLISK